MLIIPHSSNVKTGDIIQSYSARNTCPNRCPFKNNGCYADNSHVSMAWNLAENPLDNRYVGSKRELYLSLLSATADHARKGFNALQCLSQTKGISCKDCGICARHRNLVIVFAVHGNNAKKASTVIMLKQASSN